MAEPRGHMDMYGALLIDKDSLEVEKGEKPDLAVLFMHNEGTWYSESFNYRVGLTEPRLH